MPRRPIGSRLSLDIFAAVLADPRLARVGRTGLAGAGVSEARVAAGGLGRGAGPPHRAPHARAPGQGRLLGHRNQARAGARASPTIRCSPARPRPTCSWIACARRMLEHRDAIARPSPRTTRTAWRIILEMRRRPRIRDAAPARHGRGAVSRVVGPDLSRAGVRARSARMRICWPIWCGACWRTAPTPVSSIGWSIPTVPEEAIVADPVARVRAIGAGRNPRIPLAARSLSRSARTPPASTWRIATPRRRCWPRSARHAGTPATEGKARRDPRSRRPARLVGSGHDATPAEIDAALHRARARLARLGRGGRRASRRRCWNAPPT